MWMFLITAVVLSVWVFLLWKHWEWAIKLHHFITFVLSIAATEFLINFLQYAVFNSKGRRSILLLIMFILLNVLRNTSARVLTLLVSLGYGITKHIYIYIQI